MRYFVEEEFLCKCGCGLYNMDTGFLSKLDFAREYAGVPFVVASGCRCREHNKAEGGEDNSDHLTGQGADIVSTSSWSRWKIVRSAIAAGIRRIGIAKTFIHLGDNLDNPHPVIWLY